CLCQGSQRSEIGNGILGRQCWPINLPGRRPQPGSTRVIDCAFLAGAPLREAFMFSLWLGMLCGIAFAVIGGIGRCLVDLLTEAAGYSRQQRYRLRLLRKTYRPLMPLLLASILAWGVVFPFVIVFSHGVFNAHDGNGYGLSFAYRLSKYTVVPFLTGGML